ncbi:hypothetical protein BURPS406E_K0450 [Burkholderia pseudomallei 406e]|uniref:Uncharacterized protein n=3 Tax=pseudomallei group TaxID=111527 RepID=A2S5I4_BURM9|nr:hypothetical protein BMASAVP1_A0361 [Burkholderia mallei SAVP1]ABN02170.1 hypothetical protein BMA10229_A1219 [Burkholderia mallei NCTC 10229]ABN85091.1 hypothetical protein BURPS668_3405 [Burkholderia pseudomallei 668]ABN92258.1 hypothetical protein BURPS1106A_3440 [Burkholderia pseudomallei 1106a]ABO07294.1 hypothetical protein BMA10247_2630 [Burkholderia mallei NCTC 10247]ACQ96311.1 conserved hypothetical protein [Burkholderia pseudomallei MSHR346]EBA48700.1 hypothetical protein BURPS30
MDSPHVALLLGIDRAGRGGPPSGYAGLRNEAVRRPSGR